MKEISKEKLAWMNEIEMKEFETPMKYHTKFGQLYSEEYIRNTPLDELKAGYNKTLPFEKEIK
ncbi:hypothetical protein PMSD_11720 [Paenibacillus macquariensis subsp. defensor]|nr:hypothetical protein PMSD_11720 [Paenibacillus macquariensis subsp. defensor]